MTERSAVRVRRTGMMRTLLLLVVLTTVLVGCGVDADQDATAEPQDVESSVGIDLCTPGPASGARRELTDVDVDGFLEHWCDVVIG